MLKNRLNELKATVVKNTENKVEKVLRQIDNQIFNMDSQTSSQVPEASVRQTEEHPALAMAIFIDTFLALTATDNLPSSFNKQK